MKKEFKFYLFLLISFFCVLGSFAKPFSVEVSPSKSETQISKKSKTFLLQFSFSEQKGLKKDVERKNSGHLPLDKIFSHYLFSFSFVVFILYFFKISDLSYWDQQIQILSSRSHPPTL